MLYKILPQIKYLTSLTLNFLKTPASELLISLSQACYELLLLRSIEIDDSSADKNYIEFIKPIIINIKENTIQRTLPLILVFSWWEDMKYIIRLMELIEKDK